MILISVLYDKTLTELLRHLMNSSYFCPVWILTKLST